ncbi:hypothetical protein GOBAR_DD22039 [Gossypium barbadense]|nr:hypothetical protein GOBAR_DD22039 [Gossypium barbadense]
MLYTLDDIGSGSHVHLSLWQNGQNVFQASDASSQHGMSKVGEELMAGVLLKKQPQFLVKQLLFVFKSSLEQSNTGGVIFFMVQTARFERRINATDNYSKLVYV